MSQSGYEGKCAGQRALMTYCGLVMVGGAVAHPSLHSGQAPAATPEPDVTVSRHPALQYEGLCHTRGFRWVAPQPLAPVGPVAIVGAFLASDPSLRSGQALDVPDNRRIFVAGQGARPVAGGLRTARPPRLSTRV